MNHLTSESLSLSLGELVMALPTTETSIGGLMEEQEALRTLMCIPSYLPANLCKVGITRAAAP